MKLVTAGQMREADARAAAAGVSTADLMEAAGLAVARELLAAYPAAEHVVVLCGRGNNGGDGYVAGAELLRRGRKVSLYEPEGADRTAGDVAAARAAFVAAGGASTELARLEPQDLAAERTVVLDALFGTGLNRPLEGALADLVEDVNAAPSPVVAVDVPSGLNADLAEPIGPHVRADLTVELAARKPAGLFFPNRGAYGRSVLADIGLPAQILEAVSSAEVLTEARVRPHLPRTAPDAHKYTAGTVAVVAGSGPYLGAAELACRAAWRGGAGLVTLVAEQRFAGAWPETVFAKHDPATWPPDDLQPRRAGAMVIGPGLAHEALAALPDMLEWAPGPVVLDATALAADALHRSAARLREITAVLTPHAGEAARLLAAGHGEVERVTEGEADEHARSSTPDRASGSNGDAAALVRRDPLTAARLLAQRYSSIVVLKGPATVICEPGGQLAVSTRGTPALASGGTGDVLAGLLGALLASPGGAEHAFHRVCLGVWLHGHAGELTAAEVGRSLVASDVVRQLPHAIAHLEAADTKW